MTVRELIKELLNCNLDSEVVVQATGGVGNSRLTVIGNEIQDVYEVTEMLGTVFTRIQAQFHDVDRDGFLIKK